MEAIGWKGSRPCYKRGKAPGGIRVDDLFSLEQVTGAVLAVLVFLRS
jgi:hypothetical protein